MTHPKDKTPVRVKLGERRTMLVEVPDSRPIVGETIYDMTHELCVPGGWEIIITRKLRAPHNLSGTYGPVGQMLENADVRRCAAQLFEQANSTVKKHPFTRLAQLVSKVQLQEGTGEVGGWDDAAVAMEMADLLSDLIV